MTREQSPSFDEEINHHLAGLENDELREDEDAIGEVDSREPTTASEQRTNDGTLLGTFRELFFSAFSDNYQDTYSSSYCCGAGELLLPGEQSCCSMPLRSAKVHPDPSGVVTRNSSLSNQDLEKTASQDSSRRRRKKPLAIAVGYNYAEDMDGRPVVITPGRNPFDRSSSRSLQNSRRRSHGSPASIPKSYTVESYESPISVRS